MTTIGAFAILGVLVLLTAYVVGWEIMVFGAAAALVYVGGWLFWPGVAISLGWAAFLAGRRWRRLGASAGPRH